MGKVIGECLMPNSIFARWDDHSVHSIVLIKEI